MTTTINASTVSGLVNSADTSGILQLQTASTAALTITAAQNVGIGTASPAQKLHVSDTTTSTVKTRTEASTGYVDVGMGGNSGVFDTTGSDGIRLRTSGNDQVSIDTAGVFKFNSGYGSVATAYGCRAWVNFNGTGTVAIRASGNVSSITDNGTANYTVNFSTSLPDINYCIVASGTNAESNGPYVLVPNTYADVEYAPTTTSCRVGALVPGVSWSKDQKYSYVSIFR